jgi:hypothetical protein
MIIKEDIVVVAWKGEGEALQHIQFDAQPNFQLYLFNYSGNGNNPLLPLPKKVKGVFSFATEFKGQLLERLQAAIADKEYRYIGILDDDHEISVSDINRMLTIATELNADSFQPSLTHDSHYSHRYFLQKSGAPPEQIGWIEIMAPFLRKFIFDTAAPFYKNSISSYGIDRYVYPYIQRKHQMDRRFLIHEVALRHLKPVTYGLKVLSHGLDAMQENERTRLDALQHIRREGVRFSPRELWKIYEVGFPPIFKWRDDLYRFRDKLQGKR